MEKQERQLESEIQPISQESKDYANSDMTLKKVFADRTKKVKEEEKRKFEEGIKLEELRKGLDLSKNDKEKRKNEKETDKNNSAASERLDRKSIEKSVKREIREKGVEVGWDRLSDEERKQYRNEDGEPDIEKYEEKLEQKRDEVNEKLEGKGVPKISRDVFYELMGRGYKPEDIKVKPFNLYAVEITTSAVTIGAYGVSILAFMSKLVINQAGVEATGLGYTQYTFSLIGSAGLWAGIFRNKFGGIEIPVLKNLKKDLPRNMQGNMHEKDFEKLIGDIGKEIEYRIKKEIEK